MSKVLLSVAQALYRVWFYLLTALPIFIFFPFLFVLTLSERTYPQFFWLARNIWARFILFGMFCRVRLSREEKMKYGQSYMLVANHTSMLDIMLMLVISKNPFVFVGKKELAKIPIFGFFYKRVCILVDREKSSSRAGVYRRAQHRLNQGLSICIFPEGGVPDPSVMLDSFKDGAFKMAISHNIPIVPMVFFDNKKRFPFAFFSGSPGKMRAKVLSFRKTEFLGIEDSHTLKTDIRERMFKELENHV
jgi:1-acyl-sn-glycerol-3-phosphate acyltransferase